MNFEILASEVRFSHLNVRTENHGDEEVTAIDLKLEWTTSNEVLEQFHPRLLAALYEAPSEAQQGLTGVPAARAVRTFSELAPLAWHGEVPAAALVMHHGLGEGQDLKIGHAAADNFVMTPLDGGTVEVSFRVRAVCEDERILGRLPLLLHRSLPMTLTTLAGAGPMARAKGRKGKKKAGADGQGELLGAAS
jgi:hypothetical protein